MVLHLVKIRQELKRHLTAERKAMRWKCLSPENQSKPTTRVGSLACNTSL